MDHGEILLQEIIALCHRHAGLVAGRQGTKGLLQMGWSHVIGRCVDQIADKIGCLGFPCETGSIHPRTFGQECINRFLFAVFVKTVGSKQKTETCQIGVTCLALKMVFSCRKMRGEPP